VTTHRRWTLALGATVLAVALAVHGPVLAFPYLQEDWEILADVHGAPMGSAIAGAFAAIGQIHYRPLVTVYLIVLDHVTGLDGRLSHAIVLGLLAAAAFAIAKVIETLTRDRVLASLVAVSWAAANVIHLDPLMIQTCGIENMGGALLFFGSAWLFLRGHAAVSAALYALGLLVKETVVVLPALLLLCALVHPPDSRDSLRARAIASLKRLLFHAPVLVAYLLIKSRGQSPFRLPDTDPYRMSLFGAHLWHNLVAYLGWTRDALSPGLPGWIAATILAAVLVAGLALGRAEPIFRPRFLLFFIGWFLVALGPMLILTNHTFRYYLVFALPAALAVWWSALRIVGARLLADRPRADVAAAALAVLLCIWAGVDFRRRIHARVDLDGANATLARAADVQQVSALLRGVAAQIPDGATLIIDPRIQVWSFGREAGPQLWSGHRDLRVFSASDLEVSPTGELSIVNAANHQGELYTGAHNRLPLEAATTFTIRDQDDQLLFEPVSRYVEKSRR
jgi:hypothetical protein